MKLHVDNQGFEGNLPEKRIDMTIENSAKMFSILSDGIYKDKILAVIREYICNAFDAHVSVGKKEIPFTVRLPSYFDTTFSVTDEGTGVDPSEIGKIFWTYGRSTKTDDENTIGALGLGSKSAFAYTKSSFIVKNRYEGVEYVYFCFINEHGTPQGSKVSEEKTSASNGITVEFAVRPEDIHAFYDRYKRIHKYWANVKPTLIGVDRKDINLVEPKKIIEGENWYLEEYYSSDRAVIALAIMGNVAYPIESASIPNLPPVLNVIANNPFIITFPLGDLEFVASRESLSYTEFTCKQLIYRLEKVRNELTKSFNDKVFATSSDHISLYQSFSRVFSEFRNSVRVKDTVHSSVNRIYSQMLLGKNETDTIEFKGTTLTIDNLIHSQFNVNREFYQNFGLYNLSTRKNLNIFLEPSTTLTFKTIEACQAKEYYDNYSNDAEFSSDHTLISNLDWRANYVRRRVKDLQTFDKVLMSIDKFNVITTNKFKVKFEKLIFVINDVGGTGRERFKALSSFKNTQLVFVDYNDKVNTLEEIKIDLNNIIAEGLTGATITLISDLPDYRPPIVKEKIDKESIKLVVITFEYQNQIDLNIENHTIKCDNLYIRDEKTVIISLNSLRSRDKVFFIIKRRSKIFDDVGSNNQSIHKNTRLLNFASTFGMLEDAVVVEDKPGKSIKTIPILVINETQHAKLMKRGVKLASLSKDMDEKITIMEETEKFTNIVNRFMTLSKVIIINRLYNGVKDFKIIKIDEWKNSSSYLKSIFVEYCDLKNDDNAIAFAKLEIFIQFKKNQADFSINAEKINNHINKIYPMIQYANFYNYAYDKNKTKDIINYIEQVDALLDKAVTESHLAVEHLAVEHSIA